MMGTLISVNELNALLPQPNLRIIDCRTSLQDADAGPSAFASGHLPGAVHANLDNDLSGPTIPGKTGRHPLPDPAAFASTLVRWGISNNSRVVVYDADNGAFAARLWWMLRWLGHDDVSVLNGGLRAWTAAALPLSQSPADFSPGEFIVGHPLTKTVSAEDLLRQDMPMLDARDPQRFRGEIEPIDPVAGHIPGAVCAPFANNLGADGCFKPAATLATQFSELGITEGQHSICYCGSGVTAAHNILAIVHAGLPEPALYPGSWSEWITRADYPIAT